jgi:hypothetical protein
VLVFSISRVQSGKLEIHTLARTVDHQAKTASGQRKKRTKIAKSKPIIATAEITDATTRIWKL